MAPSERLLRAAALLPLAACCSLLPDTGGAAGQPRADSNVHKEDATMSVIRTVLEGRAKGPTTFVWWARGGEPGPGYTSDRLELTIADVNSAATAKYIRARFDRAYEPPFLSEEFSAMVPAETWRAVLSSLEGERLFEAAFPSEGRSNVADVVKETFSITADGVTKEKTLYGPAAGELGPSRTLLARLAGWLVQNGERKVRSTKAA